MKSKKIISAIASVAIMAQCVAVIPTAMAGGPEDVAKLGLVYSNDGTGIGDVWMAPTGGGVKSYVDFKTDKDTTYAELTSDATGSKYLLNECSYMYAPLGEDKIKFEEDKTIVVDMKLRAFDIDDSSINKRVQIKYNLSEDYSAFNLKYQGPQDRAKTAVYEPGSNHLALADINYFGMRFSNGAASSLVGGVDTKDYKQNHWINPAYKDEMGSQNNKWYRYVMKIDYGMNITYEVYKDGETTPCYKQKGQPHWITASEYLENIAIMNLFGQSGNVDVDYLNVYNVPKSGADNFESYNYTFDETKISNVKVDGVAIEDLTTATKGTVTFDSSKDVTVSEVYYVIDNEKVLLDENEYTFMDNTVKFKNPLKNSAEYTVTLDRGYDVYPVTFKSGYISKIGLIYSNDGTSGFYAPTDLTNNPTIAYNDGYVTMSSSGKWVDPDAKTAPYILASLGNDKIKFEEDKTIVIETRVKLNDFFTSLNALKIGYNLPQSGISSFTVKNKSTGADVKYLSNNTSHMVEFRAGSATSAYIRFGRNSYLEGISYFANPSDIDNQWFKVVMKIKPGFVFDYDVYDESGKLLVSYDDFDYLQVTKSEYFENLAFVMTHNTFNGKVDIDYIKVYNMLVADAENYTDSKWQNTLAEAEISNVKVDGVGIDELKEATKGTVTFDSTADVTVKEVYYKAGNDKVTLSPDDYIFSNNTLTFKNKLVNSAEYTVVLDKGYEIYPIVFNSVWKQKIGLIYSNDGTSGWVSGSQFTESSTRTKANISYETDEDGTTFMHLAPSGDMINNTNVTSTPYAYATLGGNKIKFEDENVVIVEMKLRTNAGVDDNVSRVRIDYNMPEQPYTLADFNYINKNTGDVRKYEANLRRELLQEYYTTKVRFGTAEWPQGATAENSIVPGDWYKTVIILNPDKTINHKVMTENGTVIGEYKGAPVYVSASDYFENIAASFWLVNNGYSDLYTDIDYVKVYTVPETIKNQYSDFTSSYEMIEISDVKVDGVALSEGKEATKGTVTFESSNAVNVKEVYYEKDGVKTSVSEYSFKNNTITFNTELESNVKYTVVLDLGYTTYPINFDSEYIQPVGLIYENDGESGWEVGYDFKNNQSQKAEISYVDGYMHFVPSGSANNTSYLSAPMVYASLGDDKIKFKKDYTIVTEMMVRTNVANDAECGRTRISYGFPEESSLSGFNYVNDQTLGATSQVQTRFMANLCSEALLEFYNSKVRFGVQTYPVGDTSIINEKWYKVVIAIDGNYKVRYTLIDPETDETVISYGGQLQVMRESGFFENIALYTWMHSGSLTKAYTDVDYIKVYNMPSDYAGEYDNYDGIVSEEEIVGIQTNGVIRMDIDEAVESIEITNRNNKEITFGTSVSDDGKTLTIRVDNPLDGDRYEITVNGETKRYNVVNPYFAELSLKGFKTDIPDVYAEEGAKVYKAQYDAEGRLISVESKAVTSEITSVTLSDDSGKVFLWDENNTPLATYKDTYTVGFLGGSLTEQGALWRSKVQSILAENMPEKEIVAYGAGKGGTNSSYGANRFEVDLGQYDLDLLFIDFAVNDREMTTKEQHTQYMENIIQQCLKKENVPEIVFIYTPMQYGVDHEQYKMWKQGVEWKEELAAHYGIKTINIYDYMYAEWEKDYKEKYPTYEEYILAELGYRETSPGVIDVHAGFAKYAEAIAKAYEDDYEGCFTTPKNTVLFGSNVKNIFAKYNHVTLASDRILHDGWTMTNYDNPGLSGKYHFAYPYFVDGMLQATTAGATVEIKTDADQLGFSFPSSTKGGSVTYYIDGASEGKTINCSSIYDNVISQKWIVLPGDGKMHTVKIVTNEGTDSNYLVRVAEFIEYYAGK